MNAMDIVRQLETYEIQYTVGIYSDLSEDEAKDIIQYLVDRKNGNKGVLRHQSGKDSLGKVGKVATTTIMSAGGAAGVVSTGVGGTILGSHTLATVLGGFLTVSNPVGWILGGAAAAAALGYGVSKLVESGGKNDHIRTQNIRNAKSGEMYNPRRTIEPLLFLKRAEILNIVNKFNKLKRINAGGGADSEMEIDEMFDVTTQKKIRIAAEVTDRELHTEMISYIECHSNEIASLSNFLNAAVKHKLFDSFQQDTLLSEIESCDLLMDEFRDCIHILERTTLLNLQVRLFKTAILVDGKETNDEMEWYYSSLQLKGVKRHDAENLYNSCQINDVSPRDALLMADDLFGQCIRDHLVHEIASLLSVDGFAKVEYVFLKEVCNLISTTQHYSITQYEKEHRLMLAIDKAKSFFM